MIYSAVVCLPSWTEDVGKYVDATKMLQKNVNIPSHPSWFYRRNKYDEINLIS